MRSSLNPVLLRAAPAQRLLRRGACTLALSAFLASVLPVFAQLPAISVEETVNEIHLAADFTGNSLTDTVIIDRTSGAYRLGRQNSPGNFVWGEPQATGVGKITGATAGLFVVTGRHALVVAAPEANRVSFIDPLSTTGPILSDTPNTLGPLSLASGQIFGSTALEDLLVTTSLNSGPNSFWFTRYVNQPAGTLAQSGASTSSPVRFDSAGRVVLKTSLSSTVGFMQRASLTSNFRVLSLNESGSPQRLIVTGLPAEARFVLAPFAGAAHGTLITYVPGQAAFTRRTISEGTPDVYSAGAPVDIALPFPAGAISAIKGGGVVRLAVLREDGLQLAIFEFDGLNLGALVQTVDATSPSEPLAGIVSLGNADGFMALHAAGPGRGSVRADPHLWDGGTGKFVAGPSATFPEIAPRAGAGNITLLTAEPFVTPSARPISLRNARDWTSGPPPILPGSINVTAEVFLSEPQGLGNPVAMNLGTSPAGASHTLLNQYAPGISVFTLSRAGGAQVGQVGISPGPGVYSRAVELRFRSLPAGLTIFFRDAGGVWQTFVDPGPELDLAHPDYALWFGKFSALVRYKNTTIEYYGRDGFGRRTPVRQAQFRFTSPPETLSSLGDNVPDYVKLGLGINPFRLPEGESAAGVANSLQRVLRGSGVDPRWLAGSAFDLYVRPLSHNGTSASTGSRRALNPLEVLPDGTTNTGNQIFVYSLSGSLLAQGKDPIPATATRNEGLGIYNPPFTQASAFIPTLGGADKTVFLAATRASFALAGILPPDTESSSRGRELFGLLPVSPPAFGDYTRAYTGGTDASEAAAWVSGATAFYSAQPPPVVSETINSIDVVAALVFERWLLQQFLQRDLLPASFAPPAASTSSPPPANPNHLTLSGFRTRETAQPMGPGIEGAVSPTPDALRAIEQWHEDHPAYRLSSAASAIRSTVATSGNFSIAALRSVVLDIFRISAAHGNQHPGAFDPPIDVLRAFLATGEIPEVYTAGFTGLTGAPFSSLSPAIYTQALNGVAIALAAPQPRPNAVFVVEMRPDSHDWPGCLVVNRVSPSFLYSLFNHDGAAFRLPANFNVLPGTRIEIRAFTDASFPACVGAALEVIEVGGVPIAEVTLLPSASGEDTDGNLLGDAWELAFFGHLGVDPWEDMNGDGYTNLQKYLAGKDPFMFPSYSMLELVDLQLPVLHIESLTPGFLLITFEFPAAYALSLNFHLFENATLAGPWTATPLMIESPSPGQFEVVVPYDVENRGFWRVGLSLK
jgi:hypothetical protein